MRMLCSCPGGSSVWLAPKLLGVSSGAPIKTLNALKTMIQMYPDTEERMYPNFTLTWMWTGQILL